MRLLNFCCCAYSFIGTNLEKNVVNIYMEYLSGGSLNKILKSYGPLAEPVFQRYAKQIVEGVDYIHSKNVVHRWVCIFDKVELRGVCSRMRFDLLTVRMFQNIHKQLNTYILPLWDLLGLHTLPLLRSTVDTKFALFGCFLDRCFKKLIWTLLNLLKSRSLL